MTARPAKRLLAHGWVYLPAASSPVGGGLIKLGQGSTRAAVAVGMAPYAVCALLFSVFAVGYPRRGHPLPVREASRTGGHGAPHHGVSERHGGDLDPYRGHASGPG